MGRSSVAQSKGKADEGKGKGKKGPVGKKKMRKDDRNGIKAPETQEIDKLHDGVRKSISSSSASTSQESVMMPSIGATSSPFSAGSFLSSAGQEENVYCKACRTFFPAQVYKDHTNSKTHKKKAGEKQSDAKKGAGQGAPVTMLGQVNIPGGMSLPSDSQVAKADIDTLVDSLSSISK